mgnify:FL=1
MPAAPLVVELRLDVLKVFVEAAFTTSFDRWLAKPGTLEGDPYDAPEFSFDFRGGNGRCEGRWIEVSWIPSKFVLTWTTRATRGIKTRLIIVTESEGDSCTVRLTHEGLPDEQSRREHEAFWTASLKSLPAAQPGFMRGEPPAAPKTPPKVEPGFWFWGSVPVRILETPDGGLDAERLDRKTGKWVRDVRMISEVYFNPGGSTPAEKVGEKKFYSRVAGMLKKNC